MSARTNFGLGLVGKKRRRVFPSAFGDLWPVCALCLVLVGGCQEPVLLAPESAAAREGGAKPVSDAFTLQAGDTVRIGFPSTPGLDSPQTIRGDGRLNLPMIGEVQVSGKTPVAFEKELITLYAPHLVSKEVTVTVMSAPYAVFVSGAVQRPGKVVADHPLSALEAIMEAGGFDNAKANMAAVVVVRQVGEKTQNFTLNLKHALEGRQTELFMLRRSDIVYVPEKFTWF